MLRVLILGLGVSDKGQLSAEFNLLVYRVCVCLFMCVCVCVKILKAYTGALRITYTILGRSLLEL